MSSFSRQDVLRILEISSHQLHGWERAGLIPSQQTYTFQDLGQLRTLRALRAESVPAASIRSSIQAMKKAAGMENPLLEACVVRSGARIVFRHHGAVIDPICGQLLFDFAQFDSVPASSSSASAISLRRKTQPDPRGIQDRFLSAVQAEEAGDKKRAIAMYEEILQIDPQYAPAYINLGTMHFHLRQFARAEDFYRKATQVDPEYVLAYFDLGNVLDELERMDESIAAYRKAVALAPRYADAHYNLALAYERKGEHRLALKHWRSYIRLDNRGPWADHAHGQIKKLLKREKLGIASRANAFIAPRQGTSKLRLV